MRAFFILALVVTTLISTLDTAVALTKQENPTSLTQGTTEMETTSGRILRVDATASAAFDPEAEERGIADVFKRLGTSTKAWVKDVRLKNTIYWKSNAANLDEAAAKLVDKKINPDQIYRARKLYEPENRVNKVITDQESTSMQLLRKHYALWKKKYPTWESKDLPATITGKRVVGQ